MKLHRKKDFGMITPEMLQRLNARDWKEIFPKLVLYALYRLKIAGRREAHLEAKDFAQQAIVLVYEGKRKWNPDQVPDLLVYLKGVVHSLVSHHFEVANSRIKQHPTAVLADGEKLSDPVELIPAPDQGPLEKLELEEIQRALLNWASDDETLQKAINSLFQGMKRRELASELDLPLAIVDNCLKKIRRVLNKFLDENNN